MADTWFDRRTHDGRRFDVDRLVEAKSDTGQTVSLVIPARNEAATIGDVVGRIHEAFVERTALVDDLVVVDGSSTDDTVRLAQDAGATVHRLAQIRPDLGENAGKGEAIWKSQFVTSGDLLAFVDADLTQWDVRFVTGLLGPLLTDPEIALVKGFYERPFRGAGTEVRHGGGRATELVARPLLALLFPELSRVVQPLAGEWAVRRAVYETLTVPVGYGVDLAALIDIATRHGLDAVAQVDLGVRAHSHQSLHDLGAMAVQLAATVLSRAGRGVEGSEIALHQYLPGADGLEPVTRDVDLTQRPPAVEVCR